VPVIKDIIAGYLDVPFVEWLLWGMLVYFLIHKAFMLANKTWIQGMTVLSIAITAGYTFVTGGIDPGNASFIWLVWSFFVAFVVKVEHPPVDIEEQLSPGRRVIGWLSMLIFLLCISPNPIYMN